MCVEGAKSLVIVIVVVNNQSQGNKS